MRGLAKPASPRWMMQGSASIALSSTRSAAVSRATPVRWSSMTELRCGSSTPARARRRRDRPRAGSSGRSGSGRARWSPPVSTGNDGIGSCGLHTCLHLLCSLVPAPVTGGSIRDGSGRLDFDLPESTLDKQDLTARLNRLVVEDHPVTPRWISDEELDANPSLVRTMSVAPPRGQGRVRVLEIEGGGPAAVRRYARGFDRRDRAGAGDEDREERTAESARERHLRPLSGKSRSSGDPRLPAATTSLLIGRENGHSSRRRRHGLHGVRRQPARRPVGQSHADPPVTGLDDGHFGTRGQGADRRLGPRRRCPRI